MPTREREGAVPSFKDVTALREALEAKARFEPIDLYPRDGSELLGEFEATLAYLARTATGTALAYGSGMAAVTSAVEVGLKMSGKEKPTLAQGEELYSQTQRFTKFWLEDTKRAKVMRFKSNDLAKLEQYFAVADVILIETIGNYLSVPVTDMENLLRLSKENPHVTVVIDNTFPLSTGMPLGEQITPEHRIIVAESGTKGDIFNEDTLGVAYSKDPELLEWLRKHRRTLGSLLGVRSLQGASDVIATTIEGFDERNKRVFANTLILAEAMQEALKQGQADLNPENDPLDLYHTSINHPGLDIHDDHERFTQQFPDGGVPAFYVYSELYDQYKLAERLWEHPGVREQCDLGQSFGFNMTRIVADENVRAVRIAGGADINAEALGKALGEALTQQPS